MRWPILASLGLLASPAPAHAGDPLHTCTKLAPDAKLTIPFTPDLTLRDLGAWITGFTCKSVVYDAEAAARATKLALIAPSAVTPRQAVQLFVDTLRKAGLAVTERSDTLVVALDPAVPRPCLARPSAPRPTAAAGACVRSPAGARLAVSFKPDVTLDDLAAWITGFTCKQVRFDPQIATQAIRVNLIVSAKITARQAIRLFTHAIESAGLVAAEKAGGFDVTPGPRWAHCAAGARPPVIPAPPPGPPAPRPAPPDPAAVDLDAVLDAGIRKLDDTRYEIKRAALDQILANPIAVARGARIVPAMKNGKPEGFKLYAIRRRSLYARLGLENGDTVHAINGHAVDSADRALEVYTKLRAAREIVLELTRRGQPVTITIKIKR